MKRLVSLGLVMVLLVMVFTLPTFAQDETLEIYITGLPESALDWFNDVAFTNFEEGHPGVTLEIITGGWGDFDASVAAWITTGEGPDIVYLGSEYAATYGHLLHDIDPYLEGWEDLEQFLPTALNTASFDGHLRGLPLLMSPRPIFYRTDLMEGDFPLTFTEALTFYEANSIVEDGAMAQMGFMDIGAGLFDAQEFIGYIWSSGGELYNEDGTSAFDSDIVAEVLQYMYDRRRIMMPSEETAGLPPIEGAAILSDVVISGIFPMWAMPPTTDEEVWATIGIAPYPAGDNGEPIVQVFIDWLSVPAYVDEGKLELVTDFLKFITSKDNAIALNTVVGYTPTRNDAWENIRETNAVWDTLLDLTVEYGRSFSDIRASAELRPLIVEQVMLFLTDQQSLEDTQMILKEEYDAILEENGYLD